MLKTSIQTTKIFEAFGIDEGFRIIHEAGFDGVDFTLIPFVSQRTGRRALPARESRTNTDRCRGAFRGPEGEKP